MCGVAVSNTREKDGKSIIVIDHGGEEKEFLPRAVTCSDVCFASLAMAYHSSDTSPESNAFQAYGLLSFFSLVLFFCSPAVNHSSLRSTTCTFFFLRHNTRTTLTRLASEVCSMSKVAQLQYAF